MRNPFTHGVEAKNVGVRIIKMPLNLNSNKLLKLVTPQARALLGGMLMRDPAARLTIE